MYTECILRDYVVNRIYVDELCMLSVFTKHSKQLLCSSFLKNLCSKRFCWD